MIYPILTGSGTFNSEILGIKKNTFSTERSVVEYEIELYTDCDTYGICNGKTIPYKAGVVAVYRPGDMRCSRLPFRCKYLHIVVSDKEMIRELNRLPTFITSRKTEKLTALFDKIDTLFPIKDEISSLRLTAYFLSLIADIQDEINSISVEPADKKSSEAVATAKAYIEKYYMNPLTLEDISKVVHLTPNHFCTMFTSVCGISPHAYLTSIRIGRAKYLLRSTTKSITEIAASVGVSFYNYFSFLFRKELGMSPTQYRNDARKNAYIP